MTGPAICIGDTVIYWSSLIILLGVCAWFCMTYALYTARRRDGTAVWVFLPLACALAFFFARLLHWYCHSEQYSGLSGAFTDLGRGSYLLPGVLLGVALAALLVRAVRLCSSAGRLLDAAAPGAALGIALIRLSALFTNACRGKAVITDPRFQHLPWGAAVVSSSGATEYRFATFFIHFLVLLVLAAALLIFTARAARRRMKRGPAHGHTAMMFLVLYSATELVLDSTRYDSSFFRSNGFVSVVQILGAVAMAAVLVFYTVLSIRANGPKAKHWLLWLLFLGSFGVAGASEYLVQRHGDWYMGCYSAMSAGCLLMSLAVYIMYRTVCAPRVKAAPPETEAAA